MTSTLFRAVSVDVDGIATTHDWPHEPSIIEPLCDVIGGHVDVVRLNANLDMWVHDEGVFRFSVNPVATFIAMQNGFVHQPYFGPVVFTGGADADGNTLPLDPTNAAMIHAYATGTREPATASHAAQER